MKVKELIQLLKEMPQDVDVVIDDADTGWSLDVQNVYGPFDKNDPFVTISGDYENVRRGLK